MVTEIPLSSGSDFHCERHIIRYRVLIEQDEDGIFVAEVPALPGSVSQGRAHPAAVENAKEAIEAYLESLAAYDEAIPPPNVELTYEYRSKTDIRNYPSGHSHFI
jgi:predicted RNase H-like HicB family nuclease